MKKGAPGANRGAQHKNAGSVVKNSLTNGRASSQDKQSQNRHKKRPRIRLPSSPGP